MYKVHLVLDEEKIRQNKAKIDVDVAYQSLREFLLNPDFHMREIEADEGIMFITEKSKNERLGVSLLNMKLVKHGLLREYLKTWASYWYSEQEDRRYFENCKKAIENFEQKYKVDFVKGIY